MEKAWAITISDQEINPGLAPQGYSNHYDDGKTIRGTQYKPIRDERMYKKILIDVSIQNEISHSRLHKKALPGSCPHGFGVSRNCVEYNVLHSKKCICGPQ